MDNSIAVSLIALMGTLVVALLQRESRRDIESIKLEMEKRRIAFEQEFQILSDAWRDVSNFECAAIRLRPSVELLGSGEDDGERLKRKLDDFQSARTDLISTFATSRPFYSQDIYRALAPIIEIADQERWDLLIWGESCTGTPDPEQAIAEQVERLKLLSDAVRTLGEKIRAKVSA